MSALFHLADIRCDERGRAAVPLPRIDAGWSLDARADRQARWQGDVVVASSADSLAGPFAEPVEIDVSR